MKILVTGANGFVGSHLCERLLECGHEVVAAVRAQGSAPVGTHEVLIADIDGSTDWTEALEGVQGVIHLAARVHVMHDRAKDPLSEFRRVNVEGSTALADAAEIAGVGRFVYLSSIKVNGERTGETPFLARHPAAPLDPYGISKFEAEVALRDIARNSGFDLVVVRAPLVYGPGVGGNFIKMLELTRSGLPLPLGSVRNQRTMASIWNLVDLLEKSMVEFDASGNLILAGDAFSPSTADLLRQIAKSMGRPSRVFLFPVGLLRFAGRVTGRSGLIDRLAGSLKVEAGSSSNGWKWVPPYEFANSIERTVGWYMSKPRTRVGSATESTVAQVGTRFPQGKSKI